MKIKAEQLALAEKQIQDQKQVYDDKVKICEDSKPSLIEKIGGIIGGIGIGILIGILL